MPSCAGTVTYVYKFTDCAGHSHDWTYVYTISAPTLTFTNNGTESLFRWTQEGDEILLSSKNGKVSYASMLTLRIDRGVLILEISPALAGGAAPAWNYYAKPGTDTSFVKTVS